MTTTKVWKPSDRIIKQSNIYQNMQNLGFTNYPDFWQWSVDNKEGFWEKTVENLGIPFYKNPEKIVDLSKGVTQAQWLFGAKMNIVRACFQHDP